MSKLHIDILLALRASGVFGVAAEDLLTDMRRGRHRDLTLPDLERALRDLADKNFAAPFTSALCNKRWAIAAIGERALQQEGL
ncbi:MAG: hypothetical protein KF715_08575 [Candidatus Didemnitutus sp.]|nr:hypothetical protein [Candidatus Didemnitutus sp.]